MRGQRVTVRKPKNHRPERHPTSEPGLWIRGHGVTPRVSEDPITFSWDGRRIEAREGEPVAVALWRAGVRVQTRSIKFHRPRGPQCMTGDCPGCMVRVDGVPNLRGCRTPAEDGMEVESQVGVPSAKRDLLSIVDRVFPHFDHERSFVRPAPVRTVYEAIARRLAGFGTEPTGTQPVAEGRRLGTDVLVVGAGPAGLAAANAAAEGGRDVLLAHEDEPGGSLLHTPHDVVAPSGEPASGPRLAQRLQAQRPDDVDARRGTIVGIYEDTIALAETTAEGLRVHQVDADAVVLATGATEGPALVDGNDVPGVLGARAARILLNRYEVPPGDPVAVIDPGRQGVRFAEEATQAGLTVHTLEDVEAIEGDPEVTGVRTQAGTVEARAAVVDPGLTPAPELGRQAGVPYTYEAALGGRVPLAGPDGSTPVPGIHVAGSCAGVHVPEAALLQGRWAGLAAAGRTPDAEPKRLLEAPGTRDDESEALENVWRRR